MSNLRPRKERLDYKALSQGIKQIKSEPLPDTIENKPSTSDVAQPSPVCDIVKESASPEPEDFVTPAQCEEERKFRFPSPEIDSPDAPVESLVQHA